MAIKASRVAALRKRMVVLGAHISSELGYSSHREDARLVGLYLVKFFFISRCSSLEIVAFLDGDAVKSFVRARELVAWIERRSEEVDAKICFESNINCFMSRAQALMIY